MPWSGQAAGRRPRALLARVSSNSSPSAAKTEPPQSHWRRGRSVSLRDAVCAVLSAEAMLDADSRVAEDYMVEYDCLS